MRKDDLMAISVHFNDEFVKRASPGHTLTFSAVPAAGHSKFQFSYSWNGSGYTIQGGSDLACEHGAAHLMEALGYRWYTPDSRAWKYPTTIAQDKSASLQQFATPLVRIISVPGYQWRSIYIGDSQPLSDKESKWRILNGVDRTISTGHRWSSIGAAANLQSFFAENPQLREDLSASPSAGSSSFTGDGLPPTGNPPIISIGLTSNGSSSLLLRITCDADDGSTFYCFTTTSTQPTKTQIENGQNHLGAAAAYAASQAFTASGTRSGIDVRPLAANTRYYVWAFHRAAGGAESSIVTVNGLVTKNNYTFPVRNLTRGSADWNNLVNICARWLDADTTGWYEVFHDFDAADGDLNGNTGRAASDKCFYLGSDTAMALRAGVGPIGPYTGTSTPRAGAMLGMYSYANHKVWPTEYCPGVYVGIAQAYNDSGYTFQELLDGFSGLAVGIEPAGGGVEMVGIREYFDVFDWSFGKPMSNGNARSTGLSKYTGFYATGFDFVNGQSTANWLYTLVFYRRLVKTYREGVLYSYANALADIVGDVFNGDQAVTDLYNFWGDQRKRHHKYSLRQTFDHINAMQASWYKTQFERLAVILYEQLFLPPQMDPADDPEWNTVDDPFPAALSKLYSHVLGVRNEFILDSYEFIGDLSDLGISSYWRPNYPALSKSATPLPAWWTNPLMPTKEEFDAYYAAILAQTQRDDEIDSLDVVLVRGLTPLSAGGDATGINVQSTGVAYAVVGPATIKRTLPSRLGPLDPDTGEQPTIPGQEIFDDYLAGFHLVYEPTPAQLEVQSGLLFWDWSEVCRRESGLGNSNYLYNPGRLQGKVDIVAFVKVRLMYGATTFDLYSERNALYQSPANIPQGQIRINIPESISANSIAYVTNRWVSLLDDTAAMPRAFANEDFPRRTWVRRGA